MEQGSPIAGVEGGLLMPAVAAATAVPLAPTPSVDQKDDRHQVVEAAASPVAKSKPPHDDDAAHHQKKRADVWDYCASLPLSERRAYTEALLKSPEVVRSESDPLRFWEREKGDVALAGQRLVRYWNHRKDRLGAERYHKRLDLTGEGALDADTISAVQRGFLLFLPNDAHGRTVLYFDHALASRELDGLGMRDARIRAEFYMLHSALARGQPLTLVRYSETAQIDKAKMTAFQEYWTFAPYQLDSVYFAYKPPPGAKRIFKATIAPLVAQHLSNLLKVVRDHKTLFGSTPSELLRKLPQSLAGSGGSGLPTDLGGTYDAATHHAAWFQTQIKNDRRHRLQLQVSEAKLPAVVPQAARADGNEGPKEIHLFRRPAPPAQRQPAKDIVEVTDEVKDAALLPAASGMEEVAPAAAGTARSSTDPILVPATEEAGKLKAAPVSEKGGVSPAPSKPPSSCVDRDRLLLDRRSRKRKKDLAYSRDRRRKEKDEMDGLQDEVKALSKVNDGLRREEARLAILLVNCQNEVAKATGQSVLSIGNNGWAEPPRPPTAAGTGPCAGLEPETQLQTLWAEEARRLPVERPTAVAAPHLPPIPQETLLLALERMQQEQQQKEQLLQLQQLQQREKQRQADEAASLGTASLEWEVAALLQQRQAELDARKLLLQRIGQRNAVAPPPPPPPPPPLREELAPPSALQSLLQQHEELRRNQTLLDNLTRAELSQRRTASVAESSTLVRRLLEEQALEMPRPVFSASMSALCQHERAVIRPRDPQSSSQLLQLLRSTQAPSRRPVAPPAVAPTPILSEDDAILLRLLAANRR